MRLPSLVLVFALASFAQAPPRPVFVWPVAESKPAFAAPASALQSNLAGTVILYTEITPEGKTANISVVQSLGHDVDAAAMDALADATFKPATEGGVPVRAAQSYEFSFPPAEPNGWRVRRAGFNIRRQQNDRNMMFRRKPILTHYQSPEASACPAEGGSFPVVFELAKGGVPSNVRAADGDASLPAAIPAAIANWRFEPASVDGKERAAEGRFTLECGASAPASPVFRIGGGTSVPSLVYKIEPEYSEAARQAKFSGAVLLSLVVNERGYPEQMRISHLTGLGLDRQAIEAVTLWRFRPALRDGKPVPTQAQIEVSFRLL